MFKAFKEKWKASVLILILVFSFFTPLIPVHKEAHANAVTAFITEDLPRKLDKIWDKVEKYALKALTTTVFSALVNVATLTTQRLAYDAAMYVSGGGAGGDSLIETRGFQEYAQYLGEQALGEFVGSLNQSWSKLGINLCEPSPLQKLEFQKAFTADLTVNNYQVSSQAPAAAKCDWNTIKKSYSNLAESISDFSIDVDLTFDVNLKAGETVNWDTNTLTGALKEISDKFSSITQDLYNNQGIDLTKIWGNVTYLQRLMDESKIPADWTEDVSGLQKKIKGIREASYTIVDKKIKLLESQTANNSQSTLAKALYDGELSFWQQMRNEVDLGNDDDAVYKKIFTDSSRLSILMKNKLIDKTVIMQLFSENKIDNKVLKYVYLDDITDFVKKQGDDVSNFASFLEPGNNPGSVSMALQQQIAKKTGEAAQKLDDLANNQGFKNVTNIVSGRIKTPATVVQEQFKQQQIKDPSNAKWSSITGAYFNADVGTALLNVAMSTFTSTVFNNLMTKVYTGLFKPDQMINQNKVAASVSQDELRKRYASSIESEILSLDYQLNTYNLLDEFIICPDKYESSNNCVIDADWAQLLQTSEYLTIQEALDSGYLNSDWALVSKNNSLNGDKYCYQKAYCYDNLQKLRRARILPVGFELAANMCEDPENIEYCSIDKPVTLGEVVSNFYNCGQDDDHPYSLWCNLIDPNWLLKAPAMKCRVQGYSEDFISDELPQRSEVCVDDVSCIAEDDAGNCLGWGYCTKEKNVWRFSMANSCEEQQDSCRVFTDSEGNDYSFLKNTLWLTQFNTCDSLNVGCSWYSNNKIYDEFLGVWNWADEKDAEDQALNRTYFNNKVETCDKSDEGCSRLIRAVPRIGTNLIPNSSFAQYVESSGNYVFSNWRTTSGADYSLYEENLLLEVFPASPYEGVLMEEPIYIMPKADNRYFIYSAKIKVPAYLITDDASAAYNFDNQWSLTVDAYKVDGTSSQSNYIYDLLGKAATVEGDLEEAYFENTEEDFVDVDLYLRFVTVPDIDRLVLGIVSTGSVTNGDRNQLVIENLQLEEVGEYEIAASNYSEYNSENLVYVKKAPDYYNCYQDWHSYRSETQCLAANGVWNSASEICAPSPICNDFAPYCSIDEVGCEAFQELATGEKYFASVEPDDYCPEVCSGYGRYYESPGVLSDGEYINFIPDTATECSYDAVGCEEYTSVADDSGIESKEYFAYERVCEEADSPDCQTFYTWDNPDSSGAKEISRYFLKALNNEPIVTTDDSLFCNEDIYNAGANPDCYKFYAVSGGEDIDLSAGSSEYVSYHLISETITCSSDCKPYRLTRQITEDQCLGDIENLNQFRATGTKVLDDGTEVAVGTCTVYAILGENNVCSAANNGCREYRGSQSNSYFSLLEDSFEEDLDTSIWTGGIIVQDAVSYEGHSLNNLNSFGGEITADPGMFISEGELYFLTFWARTTLSSSDRLAVTLSDTDSPFSGEDGLVLTDTWQKYTLGPIMATANNENPILSFSGIASGNLYIDSIEFREVIDNYYYIKDSWETPDVCDQLPGTELTVPGYMLGCQAYSDSYGYTHYLKSFSNSCRESAVGCELVIDTQNNLEVNEIDYNVNENKSIGDLVLPLVESEASCLLGGYNWDKGRCYQQFAAAPIAKNQCELWGYYWLGDEATGECLSESISDNVSVPADNMTALVINDSYLCSSDKAGCSAFGKPSLDADGNVIECNYGELCTLARGCTCRLEESNDYICTVEFGQESCVMDTVYLVDNPNQYDNILCEANADGCDEFVDSDNGIWYFRNPGNRLCEFKEVRIDGQIKRGWFKKGTNESCYGESYQPSFGLWGFDHNLDYYIAGIDDLANYDFYAATCDAEADKCTNFIDPTAMASSGNRNYYYIWDDNIDTSSCNGKVNLSEGCVLFNNTAKNSLIYSAEKSYADNLDNDYKNVTPYMGIDNKVLNPLTSYANPYYLDEVITGEENVGVTGYVPYETLDGSIQFLNYDLQGLLLTEEEAETESASTGMGVGVVIGDILGDLEDMGSAGVLMETEGAITGNMGVDFNVPSLGVNDYSDLAVESQDILDLYKDILKNNAEVITSALEDNNTNMVIKVQRDRTCAEWLDSGDSQFVENSKGSILETNTNLIACNDYVSTSAKNQCVRPLEQPPQKLDIYSYTLRGFGWDVLDYSGYSVPYMYNLDSYKQIYLEDTGETVLAIDAQLSCERRSDCSSTNPDNYRCVEGRCYNIYNGFNRTIVSDEDQKLGVACRAYPEDDSPTSYEFGDGNELNVEIGKNTCYPFTGRCVNAFNGDSSNNTCRTDLDCNSLETCVFNQSESNDDCECDYQVARFEDSASVLYLDSDEDVIGQGICLGGINDGLFCNEDLDCQVSNRTNFRVSKSSSDEIAARCVYPNNIQKYTGLKGLCLEKSSNGNCLTWYPVDRFVGQNDIYDQSDKVALASDKQYYCLATTTNIPVLRQGSNKVMNVPLCPENRFGIDTNEYIMSDDVATGRMYYLVDKEQAGSYCDDSDDEYRKNILYAGAVVNITEEKINKILQDWPDGNLDGKSGDHCVWGDNTKFDGVVEKLKGIYQQIEEKWQGQSCLYMIADMSLSHPEYFNREENYWDAPSIYPNEEGGSLNTQNGSVAKYPIVLACRPEGMTGFNGSTTENITGVEGSNQLMYYGVDPFMHAAYGEIPKSLDTLMTEIKDIYLKHDNNCDIAFMTTGSGTTDCGISDERKNDEALARELYYLVNNVCEYHDITLDSYQNLYDTIMKKRSDDNSSTWNERKAWVLPQGEQKVCSVMAQVISDEGENKAYTNRLSQYSNYREDIKADGDEDSEKPENIELYYVATLPTTTLPLNADGTVNESDPSFFRLLDRYAEEVGEAVENAKALLSKEKCPEDAVESMTIYYKDNELKPALSYINKYLASWAQISTLKYYALNPYLSPEPYGAIVANYLYSPYRVPAEGIPFYKQHNYQYLGMDNVTLEEYPDEDPIPENYDQDWSNEYFDFDSDEEIDGEEVKRVTIKLTCEAQSSQLIEKNQLFDLYENVYALKSYKLDKTIMDGDNEIASVFALRPHSKYSLVADDYDDPAFATLTKTLKLSLEQLCRHNIEYTDETETTIDSESCDYVATNIEEIDDELDNNSCLEVTNSDGDIEYCELDADDQTFVLDYMADVEAEYSIAGLTFDSLLTDLYALEKVEEEGEEIYQGYATIGTSGSSYDQKLSSTQYNKIIMSNINNVIRQEVDIASVPGSPDIVQHFYKENISNNSLYQLDFYAQADKQAMPITNIKIDWGDGQKSVFRDYKFKNHLPVCNTSGASISYERGDFVEALTNEIDTYTAVINETEMQSTVIAGAQQGIAADPNNCIEEAFTFKHWYTNIKGYDSEGNLTCLKGIPLNSEGNEVTSPADGDVVQCMLEGSITVTNNFAYDTVQPFHLFVTLYPQLNLSFYSPEFSATPWEPTPFEPVEFGGGFIFYTPIDNEDEGEGGGSVFQYTPLPFTLNP